MSEIYQFDNRILKLAEESVIPFAVYRFIDNRVTVELVSDGLCELMQTERSVLMDRFQNDMYCNVHTQDAYVIAQEAYRFAREGGDYDVVYRERLGSEEAYTQIHAVGKHIYAPDGMRFAVVRYENLTKAIHSTDQMQRMFESSIQHFYEEAEIAISIVEQETDMLLYTNQAFERVLPPVKAYDSGITYWEYFFGEENGAPPEHILSGHCGKGRFIAEDPVHRHPVVLNIRGGKWEGRDCYVIRLEDLEDVYLDKLTGLANQDYLEQMAEDHIRATIRSGRRAACIYYDIANMKLYNAKNGFDHGNQLLQTFARIISRVFSNALTARLYADHFCLITSEEELESKLLQVIRDCDMLSTHMKIEVNAGIKLIGPDEDINISLLLDQAKIACDTIHDDAERFYCAFDEEMDKAQQDQKFIIDHIDTALANGEITVYYQPVIRTLSRKLCGFEALARWKSPELGFLPPNRFIPALEQSHQIHKLDCYVIEQLCKTYQEGIAKGAHTVPVSFNLSRLDFQMCDIFRYVQDMTARYGMPHNMLCIEITETMFTEDDGRIRSTMEKFQEAGYEVWMDDFGSGYSSLNSLKDHKFDKLKIDMVFLSSFTERSRKIIEAIVQMAKTIGIHTLAEGVETEEQFDFLRSIGCEQVQGYFFGKPLPMLDSLEHIKGMGIQAETPEQARYYGKAGAMVFNQKEPYCIVEKLEDQIRFLFISRAYMGALNQAGFSSMEKPLAMINDENGLYYEPFRKRIQQSIEQGGHLQFAFPYESRYITMTIDIMSRMEERMLMKLTVSNMIISDVVREASIRESTKLDLPTIVIADDEPVNLVLLGEMLRDKYTILYAEDGTRALELISQNPDGIAAVLLDMIMPGLPGLDVLRALRREESTRYLPVLAMSSESDLQEDILREGANQFLPKPFEAPRIVQAKVENVIENSKALR